MRFPEIFPEVKTVIHSSFDLPENPWGYAKRMRFVRQAIAGHFPDRPKDSTTVLDVGCGNGSHLALPLLQDGFRVTGIDYDRVSVTKAEQLSRNLPNARFLCGTVDDLPATQTFDVVILAEVLEHVHEPQLLLSNAVARLKADGLVIVTTPNGFGEFELDSRLSRTIRLEAGVEMFKRILGRVNDNHNRNGMGPAAHESVISSTENFACGHVQFFTLSRLNRLFESCSLSILREEGSSLLSGPIICYTLGRSRKFIEWNARITEWLPLWMASGWHFSLRRSSPLSTVGPAPGQEAQQNTVHLISAECEDSANSGKAASRRISAQPLRRA